MSQPGYCVFLTKPNLVGYSQCPNRDACSKPGHESRLVTTPRRSVTMLGAAEKCSEGYFGMLCAECKVSYFSRKFQQLTCIKCPETKELNLVVYWVNALGVFAIAVLLAIVVCDALSAA